MHTKFTSIEPDKQARILNAAMKVFSQQGYEQASTNAIVQEAQISKGLLFHYFNNKKALYLYLYDYAVDNVVRDYYDKLDLAERDLLLRLRQHARLKIAMIRKHPELFAFIVSAVNERSAEVREELDRRNRETIAGGLAKLLDGIDISRFKEGLDVSKALNIVIWTLEGFSAREQGQLDSHSPDDAYFEAILAEMDTYLDLFRGAFYREG